MVEMSRSFTLPRFGRFRNDDDNSEIGEESSSPGKGHQNNHHHPSSSLCYDGGAAAGKERVKSFVNGIVSPFTSCWQPSVISCVPGCASDIYAKQPAVVSPLVDRYHDSVSSSHAGQKEYSHSRHPRHHHPQHHGYAYTKQKYHPGSNPSDIASSPPRKDISEESSGRASAPDDVVRPIRTATFDKRSKRKTDIEQPYSNDILCGRGGSSNRHLGNIHFRELVAANKKIYVGLTKKQKMLVARKIVDAIHNTNGRFLAKDLDTGLFYDIGLPRSLEKTSQALREKNSNEMPAHLIEGEGIETCVESYQSVVNNNTKQVAGESPDGAYSSSPNCVSSNSSKKIETPSLIIPPHLLAIFDPKRSENTYEEDWGDHYHHATSPRTHYSTGQSPYDNHHHSPYPPSPYSSPYRNSYPPVNHSPIHPSHHHHHHQPSYPPSPAAGSEGHPHSHYYYQNHPPQTPPYGRRSSGHDGRYVYPTEEYHKQHNNHESYNSEHYSRYADYEQTVPRTSPHSGRPPTHYNQNPGHQHLSPRHHGRPDHHHGSIHSLPLPQPPLHGAPASSRLSSYRPSQYSHHQHHNYHQSDGSLPTIPHPHENTASSPSSRIIYRTSSNGYIRGNFDLSPERQRELKRQRNVDGHTRRTSEVSLSSAVRNSLSLEERVIGRERKQQQQIPQQQQRIRDTDDYASPHLELISPSTILQTRSRRERIIVDENGRASPSERTDDYSTLSGLAALSTAAYLQLDEDKE